ncbi:MAG: hypothetical protein KDH88_04915 [Chromatiales bacterium]|nr:hypothetical protein [Chromatiales bacterium]
MKSDDSRQLVAATLLILVTAVPVTGFAAAEPPTIRLFPTSVLEEIQQTGTVAREMETGLQDIIGRLDEQLKLYQESKCEGAEGDQGCQRLAKELGGTYLEMLNAMGQRLPDMEKAVDSTRKTLERRIRSELGLKLTPWALQENLLGRDSTSSTGQGPALRGKSGLRLSDRFAQYYKLVAHSGSNAGASMAVIASDIYLDMQEAAGLIARTQEEINRATLMEQLNQSFGMVTPQMQEIVGQVKGILFGEYETDLPAIGPPGGPQTDVYRSPLEL